MNIQGTAGVTKIEGVFKILWTYAPLQDKEQKK